MADFENEHIKGKSLGELIDELGSRYPDVHEMIKAAIQAKMVEQLAKPQK